METATTDRWMGSLSPFSPGILEMERHPEICSLEHVFREHEVDLIQVLIPQCPSANS